MLVSVGELPAVVNEIEEHRCHFFPSQAPKSVYAVYLSVEDIFLQNNYLLGNHEGIKIKKVI
jgi:hypothetical protein